MFHLTPPIRSRSAASMLAVLLAISAPPVSADVLTSADVLARTGRTIDAWAAAWWQWAFAHPEVGGDTTGAFGPEGDVGGPVFFAEGSSGGTVDLAYRAPAGQFVLLPLATYVWTLFDPCADGACAADIVNAFVDGTTGAFATIDGVPVSGLAMHIVRADGSAPLLFQVDAGPIDPGSGYGGILDAVEAGYWLMLDPLAPGVHLLSFGATVPLIDPDTGVLLGESLSLQTRLTLTVVPEPGVVLLLAGGLAALATIRRSRRRPLPRATR